MVGRRETPELTGPDDGIEIAADQVRADERDDAAPASDDELEFDLLGATTQRTTETLLYASGGAAALVAVSPSPAALGELDLDAWAPPVPTVAPPSGPDRPSLDLVPTSVAPSVPSVAPSLAPSGARSALKSAGWPTDVVPDLIVPTPASAPFEGAAPPLANSRTMGARPDDRSPASRGAPLSAVVPPRASVAPLLLEDDRSAPISRAESVSERVLHASVPPPSLLGQEMANWDLEDALGLGGGALQVGVPVVERADDGPWPRCSTPEPASLQILPEEVTRVAGYGTPPGFFLLTPLYYLRVRAQKKQLTQEIAEAEHQLERAEKSRDRSLAACFESLRPTLPRDGRFEALLERVEELEGSLSGQQRELQHMDRRGAEEIGTFAQSLGDKQRSLEEKKRAAELQKQAFEASELGAKRAKALAARIQIEMRNIADLARERAPNSAHMPLDLGARYQVAEAQHDVAKQSVAAAMSEWKKQKKAWEVAEDEARRAEAALGRGRAEHESLVMTQADAVSSKLAGLDGAIDARTREYSAFARALLELRGEVPIEKGQRVELDALSRAVERAARGLEVRVRARDSFDPVAFARGRTVLFLTLLGVVLALLYRFAS